MCQLAEELKVMLQLCVWGHATSHRVKGPSSNLQACYEQASRSDAGLQAHRLRLTPHFTPSSRNLPRDVLTCLGQSRDSPLPCTGA